MIGRYENWFIHLSSFWKAIGFQSHILLSDGVLAESSAKFVFGVVNRSIDPGGASTVSMHLGKKRDQPGFRLNWSLFCASRRVCV
jgi:hypothetical protein